MRILVTGGAGFIGSEFVRQLKEEVAVLDSLTYAGDLKRLEKVMSRISFFRADVHDMEQIQKIFKDFKPEVVVHFAAETHVDRSILFPTQFYETNVIGTHNVLQASLETGVELFINVSTDEVYGEREDEGRFKEDDPLRPGSPYAVSKAAADMLGRAFMRTYGLPVITVRPSNNYGPWQYPEKLVPVVIAKALKDEPIPVYGTGENLREWIHVSDTARALIEILKNPRPGEIYNIGSGIELKNIDVVKKILRILGKPEDLITFVRDRAGHDFRYSLNTKKIQKEIGWSPEIGFDEGLYQTVMWYIEHMEWLEEKIKTVRSFWEMVYENESGDNRS